MIGHTRGMTEKRNPLGPTGEAARANVQRVREAKNLSFAKLARKLEEVGRPIPELGLRRIEAGNRRIDVDDLLGLAAALGVPPAALLLPGMPGVHDTKAKVETTGALQTVLAGELWHWLKAQPGPPSWGASVSQPEYQAFGLPTWDWFYWSKDDTDGDD
jgi:transcriptional regulator with XRE-family HTH domain